MDELIETVEVNGEQYHVLKESSESSNQAFKGIVVASKFAEATLACGDISPDYAFELAEVRKVDGALFNYPLDRYNVAKIALRAKASNLVVEDIKSSALRAAAVNILKATLVTLDGRAPLKLLDSANELYKELSQMKSDKGQVRILQKPESHKIVVDCAQALLDSVGYDWSKCQDDYVRNVGDKLIQTIWTYQELSDEYLG